MRTRIWLLATVLFAGQMARGEVTLIADGRTDYAIVVAREAAPAERRGAREIQSHLERMSGVTVPIVWSGDAPLPRRAIYIGGAAVPDSSEIRFDQPRLGPEEFVIRTVGPHVIITGGSPRGTMYGCTELLEKLGVRWFTPNVTRVPKRTTVTLPDIDETDSPDFEYREPFFWEAFEPDWAARLRINGHHARLDESTGGHVVYGRFVHTFDQLIPPDRYFDSNPEYFALVDGQRRRSGAQLCLSNPEVLQIAAKRVRKWISENPQATIFSVSQNDCQGWCQCDACNAIANQYGGKPSGVYLWFVNELAGIIEQDHPDKLIDTLAYQFTEAPPRGIVPAPNVRVRLCPIACCEAHPYERCTAEPNVQFVRRLKRWAGLTDALYIWHYNTNFAHYLMPFPDFDEFPAEAQLYKRLGVKGIFFQGAYAPGGGGSDSELRAYVMSKLLWDVDVDTDALVSEWMKGVYGRAAPPMRKWFDLLHEKARDPDKHFFIYDPPTVHYLAPDVIEAGDRLFDEAEKLAGGDAVAVEYVAKARLGLRYVKLMQRPRVDDELRAFLRDVRKFGITQLREGQPVEQWETNYLEAHGGG